MNKRKELWWFLIPFVLSPIVGTLGSLCEQVDMTPQFLGMENYFQFFIEDPRFWVYVLKTLLLEWIVCAVLALVLGLAVRWIRMSRAAKYVVIFIAATLVAIVPWIISVRLMPRWYNLLNFVRYGNAAAFFAWLAECIWTAVKKPKQECETP